MIDLNNFDFVDDSFEGEIEFEGQSVLMLVFVDDDEEIEQANTRANNALVWARENYQAAIEYGVQELLDLKNEAWLDEDEDPVTADEFKALLEFNELSVYDDGGIAFVFDGGDLFWGHFVTISTDADYQFISADLEG